MGIFDKIRSTFGNSELESGADADSGASIKGERRRKKRLNARDDTRALIIDDSPTIVFALKKILRSAGFITLEALDAETGLNIARTESPDLIFLDIIDDSPTIVFALKKILRSAGFVTLEALDAESGLNIARTESPDLIFLDIILPGINGFAALRALRRDPITQHIPVIMISGNEQATELFFGSRIGADDFMKKPFSRFEVFARIERLLDADMTPRRVVVSSEVGDPALP